MKTPPSRRSNGCAFRRLAATTLLASTTAVHALPTVVDAFLTGGANYSLGTVGGQGPAAAGFSGTWATNDGTSADVIAGGLTYTDGTNSVASNGGAVEFSGAGNGRVSRNLANAYDGNTAGTFYFAVMIQPDSLGSGYRGIEFFGPGGRAIQIVIGEPGIAAAGNFGVRLNDNNNGGNAGDLGAGSTAVNFFVGKITFSATTGQDAISLWRNPTNLSNEASSGTATFSQSGINLTLNRVAFARFNDADGFKADEIRFGTSWTDVTTVVDMTDSDADGLPDFYEFEIINFSGSDIVNGLEDVAGPSNAPTTTDFDGDGATDADEYGDSTNPTNSDSDGDELNDGQEATAGTNPLDGDSDDDGLKDGIEVNTYGTNPNNPNTDGDAENDGLEIVQGSDPNSSASFAASLGIANVNGVRDVALYSTPLVVQTVDTQFGDNLSEWNAGYAYANAGKLYLMFTGNLQNTFNKLEIFIDSKSGGSTTFTSAGNDGSGNMNGMKFDTAFAPDYHIIARRGLGKFDLDFANLAPAAFSFHADVLGGGDSGSGFTGTGTNTKPIRVGYNGSNNLGISGGTGAANQTAAAAVQTGLELCIDLADLGSPTGPIRVMLLQNNPSHGFISNQSLGGLPAGSGNLGGPGGPPTVDFSAYAGDQFFNVDPSPVHLFGNNTAIRFTATGLTIGGNYIVQESTALVGFADIVGSDFIATNAVQVISAPVNTGTTPKYFLRVKEVPAQ